MDRTEAVVVVAAAAAAPPCIFCEDPFRPCWNDVAYDPHPPFVHPLP